jgi:uncharacterized membrane protein HdeD (DUF308 family)
MDIVRNRIAKVLSRNWWVLLLRGLIAVAFGVWALSHPGISLAALIMLFGAYALIDGVLGVWTAVAGRQQHEERWTLLLWGLVGVGVGIMTFAAPGLTALALVIYIAFWAIATGVLQIATAIRLRAEIKGEWLLILGGLASVVLGGVLMSRPGAGALALIQLIAIYAVIFGILLVTLAFRVRRFAGP